MKALVIASALAVACAAAHAEPAKVRLEIETSDLDLASEAGRAKLVQRITFRIGLRCGRPAKYAMSPGTIDTYFACIGQVSTDNANPAVQAALTDAVAKLRARN